jgi:hypothetical protein
MNSNLKFKYILLIVSSFLIVSCKKTINCPGFPEGLKNYFPDNSLLKFTNSANDTLKIVINIKYITLPRTESNNPLSVGGTGSAPICIEQLTYKNNYGSTIELYFDISMSEKGNFTKLRLYLTEVSVLTSDFYIEESTTPSSLGSGKVFGDTINMNSSIGRFNFAQLIYGQGIVKLYDVVNNCEWNRVF